ncbi:MAG: PGPGW domain-containing protein [Deltaproteobacteria bacterium]|nr:PGPGW domain-containing protein [Deltaproteobacteria bacterium]
MPHQFFQHTFKQIRRIFIALIGFTILLIGIAMMVLPGPAILVIPIGLAILATEFVWAKKTLDDFKQRAEQLKNKITKN